MLTRDQAWALIAYLEIMEERTNHQINMHALMIESNISEKQLDEAAKALGVIAERSYNIL